MMKRYLYTMIVAGAVLLNSMNVMAAENVAAPETLQCQQTDEEKKVLDQGKQVAEYAKKYVGTPYVSGGNSLTKGVDCSGFVQQVYKHFNINLERCSRHQYASNGTSVTKSELQPGDLVFYGYGSVNHVAIYIGNSQIIHAPTPGKRVCIAPLWQRGDARIIGYKRIIA